jgi:hypothetical protein
MITCPETRLHPASVGRVSLAAQNSAWSLCLQRGSAVLHEHNTLVGILAIQDCGPCSFCIVAADGSSRSLIRPGWGGHTSNARHCFCQSGCSLASYRTSSALRDLAVFVAYRGGTRAHYPVGHGRPPLPTGRSVAAAMSAAPIPRLTQPSQVAQGITNRQNN